MEEETFRIHLNVVGQEFYVRIPKDENEELLYRNAVKRIEKILNSYRELFKNRDESELDLKKLLAMTALHLAKSSLKAEQNAADIRILDTVAQLNDELTDFLSPKQII